MEVFGIFCAVPDRFQPDGWEWNSLEPWSLLLSGLEFQGVHSQLIVPVARMV